MHCFLGVTRNLLLLQRKLKMLTEDEKELIATFTADLSQLKEEVERLKAQKRVLTNEKKSHMAVLSEFLTANEATCVPVKVGGKTRYIRQITEKRHRGIGGKLLRDALPYLGDHVYVSRR